MPYPNVEHPQLFVPDPNGRTNHIYYPPTDTVYAVDPETFQAVYRAHPADDVIGETVTLEDVTPEIAEALQARDIRIAELEADLSAASAENARLREANAALSADLEAPQGSAAEPATEAPATAKGKAKG